MKMERELIKRREELQTNLKDIVETIVQEYSPEKIILFGSLAKGDIHEGSDIDLIIIKSTTDDPWQRAKEVDKIIDHISPIDILIYTPQEIQERLSLNDYFVKEFCGEGKVLYDG